jgi:hypothetical protein
MSLKDDIAAADDIKIVPVDVPEWPGVKVFVRTIDAPHLNAFIRAKEPSSLDELAAVYICEADGSPVFKDGKELSKLGKSGKAIRRIVEAGNALNLMTKEAREEEEKN